MSKNNWVTYKMSDVLEPISLPVDLKRGIEYREIGIRSHGKGIFHKEITDAETIGNKRVFEVVPNALIFNIVFAWEQAVAKTSKEDKGFIASHRFPQYLPKDNLSDIDYLLYLFMSPKGKYLLNLASPGGAGRNKTLGKKAFDDLELKLPTITEQQKIAKILSTWDKAISTTERLIENSTEQKKALMQQLLTGKKRLLDESGKRFDSEWKFSNFEDLFKVANNKKTQIKSSDYLDEGALPIVDQGKRLVSGYTNSNEVYSDIPVIVFGDHTRIIKWIDFKFAQGADGTQVLKNMKSLHAKFAYYSLLNADIPNLGYSRHMRELKEKDFKYPLDKSEQQKIATVLTNADKEIELLEQQLADLQQEKKALMQVLLTGKKRVLVDG